MRSNCRSATAGSESPVGPEPRPCCRRCCCRSACTGCCCCASGEASRHCRAAGSVALASSDCHSSLLLDRSALSPRSPMPSWRLCSRAVAQPSAATLRAVCQPSGPLSASSRPPLRAVCHGPPSPSSPSSELKPTGASLAGEAGRLSSMAARSRLPRSRVTRAPPASGCGEAASAPQLLPAGLIPACTSEPSSVACPDARLLCTAGYLPGAFWAGAASGAAACCCCCSGDGTCCMRWCDSGAADRLPRRNCCTSASKSCRRAAVAGRRAQQAFQTSCGGAEHMHAPCLAANGTAPNSRLRQTARSSSNPASPLNPLPRLPSDGSGPALGSGERRRCRCRGQLAPPPPPASLSEGERRCPTTRQRLGGRAPGAPGAPGTLSALPGRLLPNSGLLTAMTTPADPALCCCWGRLSAEESSSTSDSEDVAAAAACHAVDAGNTSLCWPQWCRHGA